MSDMGSERMFKPSMVEAPAGAAGGPPVSPEQQRRENVRKLIETIENRDPTFWHRTLGEYTGTGAPVLSNNNELARIANLADQANRGRSGFDPSRITLEQMWQLGQDAYFGCLVGSQTLGKRALAQLEVKKGGSANQKKLDDMVRGLAESIAEVVGEIGCSNEMTIQLERWVYIGTEIEKPERKAEDVLISARDGFRALQERDLIGQGEYSRVSRAVAGPGGSMMSMLVLTEAESFPGLAVELRREIFARESLHLFAGQIVNVARNLDQVVAVMTGRPGKEYTPPQKLPFGREQLAVLAEMGEFSGNDLSRAVSEAVAMYMEEGEMHILSGSRRVNKRNIFGDVYDDPVEIDRERERIQRECVRGLMAADPNPGTNRYLEMGRDAETIARQLMVVLGYAGKYNVDLDPRCQHYNALGHLYRFNDYLQKGRKLNVVAPTPVTGVEGDVAQQPFFGLTMMISYPEYVDVMNRVSGKGDVLMKDGTRMSLHEALSSGRFHEVQWRSVITDYVAYVNVQVAAAKKVYDGLVDLDPQGDTMRLNDLRTFRNSAESVLKGVGYGQSEVEWWTNKISFYNIAGTLTRHDPRRIKEGVKSVWEYQSVWKRLQEIYQDTRNIEARRREGMVMENPILPSGFIQRPDGKLRLYKGKKIGWIDALIKVYVGEALGWPMAQANYKTDRV